MISMTLLGKIMYACAVTYLPIAVLMKQDVNWEFVACLSTIAFYLAVIWGDDGPDNLREWWNQRRGK